MNARVKHFNHKNEFAASKCKTRGKTYFIVEVSILKFKLLKFKTFL